MIRVVLVQPGATEFDEQGRIKGSLSIPLSDNGTRQVSKVVSELAGLPIDYVYCAPCESARQTADAIARSHGLKAKTLDRLTNVNQGLWHGKKIEDVRRLQPRVYRQGREHPWECVPPQGETLMEARKRIEKAVKKVLKKGKSGTVALVVPEPLSSLIRSELLQTDIQDLWKAEQDCGSWELLQLQPPQLVLGRVD